MMKMMKMLSLELEIKKELLLLPYSTRTTHGIATIADIADDAVDDAIADAAVDGGRGGVFFFFDP